MPVPYITLTNSTDFGVISRGDDVSFCSKALSGALNRQETCRVIDDAIVYMQTAAPNELEDLQSQMAKAPPGFRDIPSGRLPMFYRAILATRTAQAKGGRSLTLPELTAILEAVESNDRNRDDDYYTTTLLTLYTVNPNLNYSPQDRAYINGAKAALDVAQRPPAKGGGIGPALVLGAGGLAVGGPPGGVIGFITGLVAGRK